MAVKQLGLKVAVAVLMVVVLSSYAFYWLGMTQMHQNVAELVEFSRHLEAADNFHTSIHSMLLDAEGYYQSNGDRAFLEAYKDNRAVARMSLKELKLHGHALPAGPDRDAVDQHAHGIDQVYEQYEKDLDRIMSGEVADGKSHLARVAHEFNTIFKKYYLNLHDRHNHEQILLTREASQTWDTMSVVFAVQLFLAVVAGILVIIYLDRVVLKIFNFTERMAYRDKLTGLRNRTSLERMILYLDGNDDRPRRRYGLIMLDIDHFKDFNDNYGHPAGDELLSQFARVILDHVRDDDRVVRYGGEEFLVVLQGVTPEEVVGVAEKLRRAIEKNRFTLPGGKEAPTVTASLGAAMYPQDGTAYHQVVSRADKRLYRAKEEGRNRVVGPPLGQDDTGYERGDG